MEQYEELLEAGERDSPRTRSREKTTVFIKMKNIFLYCFFPRKIYLLE